MAGRKMLKEFYHFKELAFINEQWRHGVKSLTFPVTNPSSQEVIAHVPDCCEEDMNYAISSANDAFQKWRASSCTLRSRLLNDLARRMLENEKEFASIITLECGKPIREAVAEVKYAASFLQWFGEEAKRINGDVLPNMGVSERRFVLKQPVGVCAIITPWNFPLAMITRKVGAALAAGCSVIVKPSEDTPLSALSFGKLVEDVQLPPGLVNIFTCSRDNAELAGRVLCRNEIIRKTSFTGSTKVGTWLMEKSAATMKRVSMELGGNAPFIVFNSADAKLAAISALNSRFRNSGQTCVCAERFFVQDGIYDEFMDEFRKAVSTLMSGDPLDPDTTISCVINEKALSKVEHHVSDAISHGATVICGGKLSEKGGLHYEATILSDCNTSMKCIQEETFGPVASVVRFHSEEEVVTLANTQNSGLAAYFFSSDYRQMWRVGEQLEVGMVGINETAISSEITPFGGVKESGVGREGSVYGIDEYLELKYVLIGGF